MTYWEHLWLNWRVAGKCVLLAGFHLVHGWSPSGRPPTSGGESASISPLGSAKNRPEMRYYTMWMFMLCATCVNARRILCFDYEYPGP